MKRKEKAQLDSPDRLNRLVEGAKIIGDLIADSSLRVDGEVTGNISVAGKVVIGSSAQIKGNVSALEADISGNIEGKLQIEKLLVLRDGAKIVGDIKTEKLHIEEGATFDGNCVMASSVPSGKPKNASKQESDLVY